METVKNKKQRCFSGVQPTGDLMLGHYIGALRNWAQFQEEYDCLYCVVDMHAVTVRQDPDLLRKRALRQIAMYIACGLDPEKTILFIQSHVPQHAELAWVLGCYAMFGELSRMTQFKEKSAQHDDNVNGGLFTYPVLQAADILLYQAEKVPIGEDQRQHLELSRNIAERFNHYHGDTFVVPEAFYPKTGARIMSLADPMSKMSKSDPNINGSVLILDPPDVIMKKFKRAVTDSGSRVAYGEGRDGINNLMTIYSVAAGRTFEQIEAEFDGKGYGQFKAAVGEAVVEYLRPVREKCEKMLDDNAYLAGVCADGARRAAAIAQPTLDLVYDKLGFVPRG